MRWQGGSLSCTIGQVTDRVTVGRWLADYEAAWRAPGTDGLAEFFTDDAAYLHSPYEEPVVGLDAPTPSVTTSKDPFYAADRAGCTSPGEPGARVA